MSSPMNPMNTASLVARTDYSPIGAVNRHEFGVQKTRKAASTGGSRAWSEDEEVYLLQSRLQKMPYKHVAVHLKKTELACRLHYHQLSHGSNRRKRNGSASASPVSSVNSPVLQNTMPSPMHESVHMRTNSPVYTYSPQSPGQIKLPSASSLLPRSASNSPPRMLNHPVAILPRPSSAPRQLLSEPVNNAPLRLDCGMATSPGSISSVDKDRLRSIYEAHRVSFWSVIANEYGAGVSPYLLEEAWKQGIVSHAPPTPSISPDTTQASSSYPVYNKPMQQLPTPVQENKTNSATSISALLGIDASPRSPKERELIKRMEESRDVIMT